jgi:NTP pyrophosphatase (non-canonical NTP hydrolase)
MKYEERFGESLDDLGKVIHFHNEKWWIDIYTGERLKRNKGEMLALIHSEISECLEGVRKGIKDDHLPQYDMETVELADAVIRILDYAAGHNLPLGHALIDKCLYNMERADHKLENRIKDGGKKI